MWIVSLVVLAVVGYVLAGRELPERLTEAIETYLPAESAPSIPVVAIGMIAGGLIGVTPLHRLVRYLATLVHELGHALTAGILGGRPSHITISTDTSGLAVYNPPVHWGRLRASVVSAAGYPAPAIASLAAVHSMQRGLPQAWFVFATGVLAVAVIAGFLAVEAYRHAFLQFAILRRSRNTGCDAEAIGRMLRVPPILVGALMLLSTASISGYALVLGVRPYWPELVELATGFL